MKRASKLLTVYSPNLGILTVEYKGQSKVDFIYTQESIPINEEKLLQLGFTLDPAPKKDNNYSDFSNIGDLR